MGYLTMDVDYVRGIESELEAYRDTGLTPDVCMNYKIFEDEVIASGRDFNHILELLKLDERIEKEYDSNVSAYEIIDMFLKNTEEQDGEPLKGFRILTNDDAELYDRWKADRIAEEAWKENEEDLKIPTWMLCSVRTAVVDEQGNLKMVIIDEKGHEQIITVPPTEE